MKKNAFLFGVVCLMFSILNVNSPILSQKGIYHPTNIPLAGSSFGYAIGTKLLNEKEIKRNKALLCLSPAVVTHNEVSSKECWQAYRSVTF